MKKVVSTCRSSASQADKQDELGVPINLSPDAMKILQVFSKSFVQSCFNSELEPAESTLPNKSLLPVNHARHTNGAVKDQAD